SRPWPAARPSWPGGAARCPRSWTMASAGGWWIRTPGRWPRSRRSPATTAARCAPCSSAAIRPRPWPAATRRCTRACCRKPHSRCRCWRRPPWRQTSPWHEDPNPRAMTSEVQPAATAASFTTHVLKDGDSFLVANAYGDIEGDSDGLFHDDTRLLSRAQLRIAGARPEMLSATVTRDNAFFVAHLTNQPLPPLGVNALPSGLLHVLRTRFLSGNRLYERLRFHNFGLHPVRAPLRFEYDADFRDMFEVRGVPRQARGERQPTRAGDGRIVFGYRGLDGRLRESVVAFSHEPAELDGNGAGFELALEPGASDELFIEVGLVAQERPSRQRYRSAAAHARRHMRARQRRGARVRSAGPLFSDWLERSRSDLALLTSDLDTGPYPFAGIP